MAEASERVRVEHLYKVFGEAGDEAVRRLEAGASKDEVYRETGSVVAVRDVSFTVNQGQIFVVMGLSGSGKSTLIRCVNRLWEPTQGRIELDGENILELDAEQLREVRLRKMAMVFQHFALFPHMTVGENVEYGLKIQHVGEDERRQKALEALGMVGLRDWVDTPPENLSGGMQQRVGLARALAVDPELMLMDEPFSALDPLIRTDMQKELMKLQDKLEMTIIFITHDLHEALTLGDKIAIMKDGMFVQLAEPEEIVAHPAEEYVAEFTKDVDRSRVYTMRRVMRTAEALPVEGSTLKDARARLQELGRNALYVVDQAGKPVGVVTERHADGDDSREVSGVMTTQFPTATPLQTLYEVFEDCGSGLPVAVVDEEGLLQGVVHPLEVFRALSVTIEGPEEREAPVREEPSQAEAGQA